MAHSGCMSTVMVSWLSFHSRRSGDDLSNLPKDGRPHLPSLPMRYCSDSRMRSSAYCFPPGLKHNLIWYAFRKFRPGDPIALFQYLTGKYGDAVHYKIGLKHIVFLNDPALI